MREKELGIPEEAFSKIIALVGHHHDVRNLVNKEKGIGAYAALARLCNLRLLYHLCRVDILGRIVADLDLQLESIEWFKVQAEEFGLWEGKDLLGDWYAKIQDAFPKRSEAFHKQAFARGRMDFEEGMSKWIGKIIVGRS
jgi:hypothetical protein